MGYIHDGVKQDQKSLVQGKYLTKTQDACNNSNLMYQVLHLF